MPSVAQDPQRGARTVEAASLAPGAAVLRRDAAAPRLPGFARREALEHDVRPRGAAYAALDLGTNNCRLLVARPAGGGFRVIDAFSRIIRLGEGLGATGALSEAAMGRALDALKVCADKMEHRQVSVGRYIATEACRQAANCGEFLDRVRADTGIELEIIDAAEEARLVVAGCSPLLHPRIPYAIVFDIGGGSTEIVWARQDPPPDAAQHYQPRSARRPPEILGSISLPFGVVTFTERFGGIEVTPAIYRAMVAEAEAALAPFEREHAIRRRVHTRRVQMLGSSVRSPPSPGCISPCPLHPCPGRRQHADLRPDRAGVALSCRARHRRPRRQSLRRPGARRFGAQRLRHSRRDLRDLAGRPAARRRPRHPRGHPVRPDAAPPPGLTLSTRITVKSVEDRCHVGY